MDWVGLIFLFKFGPHVVYNVRREDAERVIRQFGLGELPKTLDHTKIHCSPDTNPWALRTEDLALVQQCPPLKQNNDPGIVQARQTPILMGANR